MRAMVRNWIHPIPDMPVSVFYGRCLWIVVRVAAAYIFANQVSPFFYQQF
jgi:hypothetical protein